MFRGLKAASKSWRVLWVCHSLRRLLSTGCGNGTVFGNYTSVASHELIEAVTDAAVGVADKLVAPLAWYDATNGEISFGRTIGQSSK